MSAPLDDAAAHDLIDVVAAPRQPLAVDRIDFRHQNAGARQHPHHVVEHRQLFVSEPHAGALQPVERFRKAAADGVVEIFQRQALRDAEPQAGKRRGLQRPRRFARHHRVGMRRIAATVFANGPMESSE